MAADLRVPVDIQSLGFDTTGDIAPVPRSADALAHAPTAHLTALAQAPTAHLDALAQAPMAHLTALAQAPTAHPTALAQAPTAHLTALAQAPTAHLTALAQAPTQMIGQEEPLAALDRAVAGGSRLPIFVTTGWPQAGRAAVIDHLRRSRPPRAGSRDWVVAPRFGDPLRPQALSLPAGTARTFAAAVAKALAELDASIPRVLASPSHTEALRLEEGEAQDAAGLRLDALKAKAESQNVALLRTPKGYALAPMHEGRVVKVEVFAQLPEAWQRQIEMRIEMLQTELADVLTAAPGEDHALLQLLHGLSVQAAAGPIRMALQAARTLVAGEPEALAWLDALARDISATVGQFPARHMAAGLTGCQSARAVHVLVGIAPDDALDTIVDAPDVTPQGLMGSFSADTSTLTAVRPGALHQAGGGVLVIPASRLIAPGPVSALWDGLKSVLQSRAIKLLPLDGASGAPAAQLEPDQIPLTATIVVTGTAAEYDLLLATDADVATVIPLRVSLDDTVARTPAAERAVAGLVAGVLKAQGLQPIAAGGVAALIEEAVRCAGRRDRLATGADAIAGLIREADHWAALAGRDVTTHDDVRRALKAQRAEALRVLPDVPAGPDTTGRVRALLGGEIWVPVQRRAGAVTITAHPRIGDGRPDDIVRIFRHHDASSDLPVPTGAGSSAHAEPDGMGDAATLWGLIATRYGAYGPSSLAAILEIEGSGRQPGRVGTCAAAEALALLSALAAVPLDMRLCIGGALTLAGGLTAVPGLAAAIELTFEAAEARGLDGRDGVIIPRECVAELMLSDAVAEAVERAQFAVYACTTLDEAIEILTGMAAGTPDKAGRYADASVNGRVGARLAAFAGERASAPAAKGRSTS